MEILRQFNLDVEPKRDTIEVFDLGMDNQTKLLEHASSDSLFSLAEFTYKKDRLILENSDLNTLKNTMRWYYGMNFRNSTDSLPGNNDDEIRTYSFVLPDNVTTDSLNSYLISNYGLKLLTYRNEMPYSFIKTKIH